MSGVERLTLAALVARYLEWLSVHGYSVRTREARDEQLRRFLGWCEARQLACPGDVTPSLLERYQRHVAAARKKDGRPLSRVRQHHLVLGVSAFFRWAAKAKLLAFNPAAALELPRLPRGLPAHLLSVDEVERVLNAILPDSVVNLRDRAMLETLYSTGLRLTELTMLDLDNLDLERGLVVVRNGKGGRDRVVPIGARAIAWVERYLADARPALVRGACDAVFLSTRGGRRLGESLSAICKRRIRAAGLERPGSAHVFRHAAATGMLERGADIRFIQAMLGHAHLSSTQIYTRVAIQKLKAVHAATHPAGVKRKREG